MKTKKIIFSAVATLLVGIMFCSCNDEWKEEQYQHYVSFVRSGFVNTYVNNTQAEIFYKIPIEISGSTENKQDVTVTIELDPDTLQKYNFSTSLEREDLWYKELPEVHYEFPQGMTVVIPKGSNTAYLPVKFKLNNLDLVEKYILPLKIAATSVYTPSPKKHYKKTLMCIIPFNNYSGVYNATNGLVTDTSSTMLVNTATREMRVVDQNSVFFYAGLTRENALNRSFYKIRAEFEPLPEGKDSAGVTLTAEPDLKLFVPLKNGKQVGYYKVNKKMDDLQPYLEISTLSMYLQYKYTEPHNYPDGTSYTIRYEFKGSYTMERRRNTQIPDEDQPNIFE